MGFGDGVCGLGLEMGFGDRVCGLGLEMEFGHGVWGWKFRANQGQASDLGSMV
jgi:hypothetical protein